MLSGEYPGHDRDDLPRNGPSDCALRAQDPFISLGDGAMTRP
jgi:hypothetical protein